jgi:hypothetical protein
MKPEKNQIPLISPADIEIFIFRNRGFSTAVLVAVFLSINDAPLIGRQCLLLRCLVNLIRTKLSDDSSICLYLRVGLCFHLGQMCLFRYQRNDGRFGV